MGAYFMLLVAHVCLLIDIAAAMLRPNQMSERGARPHHDDRSNLERDSPSSIARPSHTCFNMFSQQALKRRFSRKLMPFGTSLTSLRTERHLVELRDTSQQLG
uniref:Secreted protein n=1 Tax=Bionectria ochroleuca TaxID=29856 RepID=A0A8H7K189_BIOOC